MNFKNTFVLTSIHTVIKVLAGIVMNKVVAVYLGPSGLALIGQFQNFSGIVTGLANGSIQTGIVKKTAESDVAENREKVWVNAFLLSMGFSLLTSLVVFILAEYLAKLIMFDRSYLFVMQVFSFSIIFYSLNLYLLSILNGLGEIKFYSIINICISLISLLVVSVLTVLYQLEGALLGLVLTQSFVFLLSYFFVYKKYNNLFFKIVRSVVDKKIINTLLKFGVASFSSGLISAVMMILVRNVIINDTSLDDAGIWEAAIKIGIYFNLIFALPISLHYLPKFSGVSDSANIKMYLKQAFSFAVPVMVVASLFLYLIAETVILLLFAKEFLLLGEFLIFILLAEMVRVVAGTFSTLLFAKQALMKPVKNEFVRALSFVGGAYVLVDEHGLYGVAVSYLMASFLYLIVTFLSSRQYLINA